MQIYGRVSRSLDKNLPRTAMLKLFVKVMLIQEFADKLRSVCANLDSGWHMLDIACLRYVQPAAIALPPTASLRT